MKGVELAVTAERTGAKGAEGPLPSKVYLDNQKSTHYRVIDQELQKLQYIPFTLK